MSKKLTEDVKLDFKDVLIKPISSNLKSRSEVCIEELYNFKHSKFSWNGTPIVVSNMDTTGTFEMAIKLEEFKMITCIHKHYSVSEWCNFMSIYYEKNNHYNIFNHIAVSCGTSDADFTKLQIIMGHYNVRFICLDVANGYRYDFVKYVKKVREVFPDKIIIAGNVVTPDMVKELLNAGADVVKIGIGNGSACSTRMKTGIGYPQFSAILECQVVARQLGGYIMSDGGCSTPADIVKAFGAGADFVMCGGMFAGHHESGGELVKGEDGKDYKMFYGMSSKTAMNKYSGGVAKYRTSEGLTMKLQYKGKVEDTLLDMCGGIRSACTYLNSTGIRELFNNVEFVRINRIK